MTNLHIQNLSVSTKTGKVVVEDVSFEVKTGEIHVLMGPNGSGKSSLLSGLFGHPGYVISHGSILLDNEDITELDTEEKAQRGLFLSMQYLPEIPGVTLSSFLHKAYLSLHNTDIAVMDFYQQLKDTAQELSIDAGFLQRELNVGLSGGEKKLSEALQLSVLKPKIACLDEIDSGVDVDSLRKVFRVIATLREKEGTGFLLITHYNAVLNHITPDRVHVMHEGELVASGDKELVAQIARNGYNSVIDSQ